MRKFIYLSFIVISFIFLNSCEKENYDLNTTNIKEYRIESMFYPFLIKPDTTKVKLIYNKRQKITNRIGNLISTPMMYKLYENIEDTVIYFRDSILIEKQLLPDEFFTGFTYPHKRKLFLENGLIVKEINKVDYYSFITDSTIYYYNKQNQIAQTIYFQRDKKVLSKYKYNEDGNLFFIASEVFLDHYSGTIQKIYNDTAWFLDYDNSPNLAKDLIIFQECFYRALSTNNFRKYVYKRYSSVDSILVSTEERNWEFRYFNNNPIY